MSKHMKGFVCSNAVKLSKANARWGNVNVLYVCSCPDFQFNSANSLPAGELSPLPYRLHRSQQSSSAWSGKYSCSYTASETALGSTICGSIAPGTRSTSYPSGGLAQNGCVSDPSSGAPLLRLMLPGPTSNDEALVSCDASEPPSCSSKMEPTESQLVEPRKERFSYRVSSDGSGDKALVSCDASEPPLWSSVIETTEDKLVELRSERNDASGVDGISASFGASALEADAQTSTSTSMDRRCVVLMVASVPEQTCTWTGTRPAKGASGCAVPRMIRLVRIVTVGVAKNTCWHLDECWDLKLTCCELSDERSALVGVTTPTCWQLGERRSLKHACCQVSDERNIIAGLLTLATKCLEYAVLPVAGGPKFAVR
eukprot:CAMPEP_0204227308 /NCGR_PEP_ID=MMETSP0361-20130328/85594_1 /ASSEMBLY_ACC=CAM_ASM_000343 /TAXON_ID=268821 /ORGANISM="Scrippsiella Hangoei, Strain SHTV-5" /LENGTH=370 /DNA_ID=CAMNT_0051194707 /DNA_START=206 /DNA_END=1315 /DNA_ORIENTATION=-